LNDGLLLHPAGIDVVSVKARLLLLLTSQIQFGTQGNETVFLKKRQRTAIASAHL